MKRQTWRAVKDWEPQHIFYRTVLGDYVKYKTPSNLGFGFTSEGYWRSHKEYTWLGEWFRTKPFILYFLVGLIYYPLTWLLWWVAHIVIGIFSALFSKWE